MVDSAIYPHELTGRTIRLLTVELDEPSAPLRCKLSETCLDTNPTPYLALSYCWGPNQNPVQITCNSHPLQVTPNLHSALREYRRRGAQALLWVDAICINQFNTSERTSQVRMMDKIYTEAGCVIVWLGEAQATDEQALEFLRVIHKYPEDGDLDENDNLDRDAYLVAQKCFDALAEFLLRPWFSRIWIVQELLLARHVSIWCGPTTADEDFPVLEAIAQWSHMTNYVYRTQNSMKTIKDKDERRAASFRLSCASVLFWMKNAHENAESGTLYLLMNTRWFDAADRRDKVFALVSLTSDLDESFVDYSKSYGDVMRDLNLMLLEGRIEPTMGSVLDVWSLITRDADDEIAEPSWVVDVFRPQNFQSTYTSMMTFYPSREPHVERKPELQLSEECGKKFLRIRGAVFDTITHTAPFPTLLREVETRQAGADDLQNIAAYTAWVVRVKALLKTQRLDILDDDGIYQPTGDSHYDAFWRTLCCNRTYPNGSEPPDDQDYGIQPFIAHLMLRNFTLKNQRKLAGWVLGIATAFSPALAYCFRRKNKFLRYAIPLAAPLLGILCNATWMSMWRRHCDRIQAGAKEFENMHITSMQGRQFIVTKMGLMGLIPVAARVGDSVGFFAGCRIPYVLRRRGEGYALVGDSYLHGVMNGEGELKDTEMLKIV